jgi:hypothetical protein
MKEQLLSTTYSELINVTVGLICRQTNLTLLDFSNKLEELIKNIALLGFKSKEPKELLSNIENAMKNEDLVMLLEAVSQIGTKERIPLVAE